MFSLQPFQGGDTGSNPVGVTSFLFKFQSVGFPVGPNWHPIGTLAENRVDRGGGFRVAVLEQVGIGSERECRAFMSKAAAYRDHIQAGGDPVGH